MEDRVEDFLRGIEQMFSNMQSIKFWPAKAPQMDSYYNDILAKDFYLAIEKLKKEKTIKEIAKLFDSASVIKSLLYNSLIIGMKIIKCYKILPISSEDIVNFISFIFGILKEKTNDDLFCLKKTNRILSNQEISKITENGIFSETKTDEIRKELSSTNINSQSFIWAVCFDVTASCGMEIHGPYNVSEFFGLNSVMIIRDFFDFKQPIWNLNTGFGRIRTINIYRDINFEFDMADHFTTNNPLTSNMTHYSALVDEAPVGFEKIKEISIQISEARKKQKNFVDSLEPPKIIEKSAEINYYTLRKLWAAVGEKDWKFSIQKIKKRIKNKGLKYWDQFDFKEVPELSYYKKLFDPRIDFPIK